jgi:diadenosine tetraphosphate (Ap4A) HIT family hydrolase
LLEVAWRSVSRRYIEWRNALLISKCVFCSIEPGDILDENELAVVIRDRYPVKPLHSLAIPKRCVAEYFDLELPEVAAIHELVIRQTKAIRAVDPEVGGFNVGANVGAVAGQKIAHVHVHIIPRRAGDLDPPPAKP